MKLFDNKNVNIFIVTYIAGDCTSDINQNVKGHRWGAVQCSLFIIFWPTNICWRRRVLETSLGVGCSRDLCPVTCLLQQQSIEVLRSLNIFRQRNRNCIWQKEKTVSHSCPSDYYMLSCFTTRTTLLQRQKIDEKDTTRLWFILWHSWMANLSNKVSNWSGKSDEVLIQRCSQAHPICLEERNSW